MPAVITSTPLSNRCPAEAGVMPLPSAEFSPFAITTSMPFVRRRAGSVRRRKLQPRLPTTSPIHKICIVFSFLFI